MSEMVERVALAIVKGINAQSSGARPRASLREYQDDGEDVIDIVWREDDMLAVARAAILAMREPDETALSYMFERIGASGHDLGGGVFIEALGLYVDGALNPDRTL